MTEQIYVTGAGIISAIGVGKEATLQSLRSEKTGIDKMRYLNSIHHDIPVGEVKMSNAEMAQALGITLTEQLTRTALLGRLALREAIQEASLTPADIPHCHFISATTVGGMDRRELSHKGEPDCDQDHAVVATYHCGDATEMIARQFGHFASLSTVSTACSSATNAIITGANMIRCGLADKVIVGGSESLSLFHLNGFNTLMILCREQCKPFDKQRTGLNLGEGAAYLVLESEASMLQRGVTPLCRISGYGNACDAYHQTASSPDGEGAFQAMSQALDLAELTPADIQYINAHGTGTPNNDVSESQAIKRIYGDEPPYISSTKSFTGHTTSASGSIEAVICILALKHQFVPVNLNWHNAMDDGIRPVTDQRPSKEIRNIQSNAFGFGGNDSSIIISSTTTPRSSLLASQRIPRIYIQAAEQVSIQQPLSDLWMTESTIHHPSPDTQHPTPTIHHPSPTTQHPSPTTLVHAQSPNFRDYLQGGEVRRMGNVMKWALVTTLKVLKETNIEHPDAIITGTCYGCLGQTERFLDSMVENGEETLSPTYFMQSTHNTVSSALAIHTKTHGYNTTYSHGQCSFDLALLDAWMQLRLNTISTALVGGHDEMQESFYNLLVKSGRAVAMGQVPYGEVSMAMMLNAEKTSDSLCELSQVRITSNSSLKGTHQGAASVVKQILNSANLRIEDISAVMTGKNGNEAYDSSYQPILEMFPPDIPQLHYKHIFGESYSASAMSVYAAAKCLGMKNIPEVLYATDKRCTSLHNILIVNNTEGEDVSLILLKGL